jgi:hypothetical protein
MEVLDFLEKVNMAARICYVEIRRKYGKTRFDKDTLYYPYAILVVT